MSSVPSASAWLRAARRVGLALFFGFALLAGFINAIAISSDPSFTQRPEDAYLSAPDTTAVPPVSAAVLSVGPASTTAPAATAVSATEAATGPYVSAASAVDAGRYLAIVGGCNDCHTNGYMPSGGTIPESEWLTGSPIGFRGPWGTTYPSNLRLLADQIPEDAFVQMMHVRTGLPPMPWMNVNRMSDADLRSLYQYLVALGPKGDRMPAVVPPDVEPTTPYFDFVPKHMERMPVPAG